MLHRYANEINLRGWRRGRVREMESGGGGRGRREETQGRKRGGPDSYILLGNSGKHLWKHIFRTFRQKPCSLVIPLFGDAVDVWE